MYQLLSVTNLTANHINTSREKIKSINKVKRNIYLSLYNQNTVQICSRNIKEYNTVIVL